MSLLKYRVFIFSGLLDVQNILLADTVVSPCKLKVIYPVITWSVSESVSVTPLSVIDASIVLCSVSLWLVWVNVQSAYKLNTLYMQQVYLVSGSMFHTN
jgi:hypothetical protein